VMLAVNESVSYDDPMGKILVIGANSFSGADFVDFLLSKTPHQVYGMDRVQKTGLFLPYKQQLKDAKKKKRWQFFKYDLNQDMDKIAKTILKMKPGYIINFAALSEVAPSWQHPDQWMETNVVALARLVNFLKDQKWLKKYTQISSPEAYGTTVGRIKESTPLNPSTPYAASKAAADMLLFTYVKNFDFPLVVMRATNVYGAHQQLFKIIPRTAIYLKLGKKIELHGGGKAVKSYIHIRDVSRGYYAGLMKGKPGEIYHISPDAGVAVRTVVEQMCRLAGKDFTQSAKVVAERLGQDKAYTIDSSKARRAFSWKPTISLEQGLKEVIDWVDKYWDEITQQPLEYIHQK